MTFSDSGHHSKIELSPEEMLAISREISFKFSPNKASRVENDDSFPDHHPLINPPLAKDETNDEATPAASRQIGFSFKELNDISQRISRRFAPKAESLEPELFLLPVDPLHLYVYWNVGEDKAQITARKGFANDLTLRIYWRPDEMPGIKRSNVWFDLAADHPECRQKVRLPIDDTAYSATLGIVNPDNSIDPIAHSNIVHVPPAPGRIRKAPHPNDRSTALPVSKSPKAFTEPSQTSYDPDRFIDEQMPGDPNRQEALYEKQKKTPPLFDHGWFVKLHFPYSPAWSDGTSQIDTAFMDFINKKGIEVELIPEPPFIEQSNYQGKNASGRGR
ncbi:MAG: DUF4912 domain-containing protein [Gammaproteobacteria bacterium]